MDEPAAAAEPVPEPSGEPVPLADACQRLGLTPYVLRGLLDEYAEWLSAGEGGLAPEAVERIGAIVRWRAEGVPPDVIRARLAGGEAEVDPLSTLVGRLAQLQTELARSEERRAQDRDRLMMTLVRTQQEIQRLRHDLSETRSRRDRHRGLWRRLFGG